jgi:MFS family permease
MPHLGLSVWLTDPSLPGNAKIAGLDRDLGMVGYDYNQVLSIFYISYILFEIPSNVLCKWLGPGWFIPLTSLGFGICSVGTAFVTTIPQACGVRFLLGVFEAGSELPLAGASPSLAAPGFES